MNWTKNPKLRRAGLAFGAGIALVGVVALMVGAQAPDRDALPTLADAPMAVPELLSAAAPADPAPEAPAASESPAAPQVPAADTPAAEGAPPPAKQGTTLARSTPTSSAAPTPKTTTATRASRASKAAPPVSRSYASGGLKVKFASVDDLAELVADDHVTVVLEFADGRRYRLPEELVLDSPVTFKVEPLQFQAWVQAGRVSELVPTTELRDRLQLHRADVRFLAVLDEALKEQVVHTATSKSLDPTRSVLSISRGPAVAVALARR